MNGTLVDWLLQNYGTEKMRPGLERIREALGDDLVALNQMKIVTIAGTNGKGETSLRLSHELKKISHLLWTSPHIERLTERFRDENGEISQHDLENLIYSCHTDLQTKNIPLSYYEFLFYVFCRWARGKKPDILLLEVGLGGRLDAVNVLNAKLVLLPSISRDHQEFLGKRYDQILQEKLGVLRKDAILVTFLDLKYLCERASSVAKDIGAAVIHLEELKKYSPFEFSLRNQLLAHAAYLVLIDGILDSKKLEEWTPSKLALEHRGDQIQGENLYTFFGSHNPDGLRKLIQFLESENYTFPRPKFDLVLLAFSARESRDLLSMLKMMAKAKLGKVIVTTFNHPKAAPLDLVQKYSRQEGLDFVHDWEQIIQGRRDQNILVVGSYYFMGEFKKRFC
jgi:folylpolyglutamate synthase/dihydrofolate synthase